MSLNHRANKHQIHNLGEAQASLSLYVPLPIGIMPTKKFNH
jgi:hypothetical protein